MVNCNQINQAKADALCKDNSPRRQHEVLNTSTGKQFVTLDNQNGSKEVTAISNMEPTMVNASY